MNRHAVPDDNNDLETCLLAVLQWHEQGLSAASLRSRVGSGGALDEDMLAEAADSLGYDVAPWPAGTKVTALPHLPAIGRTHSGRALAMLSLNDLAQ